MINAIVKSTQETLNHDFILATEETDFAKAQTLLDLGVNVNCFNGAALAIAVGNGETAFVDFLIANGANVHLKEPFGLSLIHLDAARGGYCTEALINAGANVSEKIGAGNSLLHNAVLIGDAERVEMLIKAGAEVSATTRRGETPLMLNLLKISEELMEDASRRLEFGPHWLRARYAILDRLVHSDDADLNIPDSGGKTALHYAASINDDVTLRMMFSTLPTLDTRDLQGKTPLHIAFACGNILFIQRATDGGADPELLKSLAKV
ncbi:ankyrin repeat domain-containing protein [Glaciimonas sp. CA11.2]|uniref:ankyrin repeat domain-containing protein n=1 Tax=Glaciimonas sp. CA11.2 TaxID=3048601 RepID=UPI002AB548F8|nr:ankyrin repeat domain-containing protein [Glaciimonas sp. CA11.2]MDY7547354.1 hypothetical protein [Glaciimonas sp. CA11.2]MEB0162937.1 ankyrin repeat domain-containing protein [Glaciimonas sp. CA11.2]